MLKRTVSGIMLTLLLILMLSALRFSSGHVPTMDYPIFELLSMHSTPLVGGVDMEFTFNNTGYPATTGTVWVPWEKVAYDTPLEGEPPSGNINETLLELDVNGDGDKLDVFTVRYVNDTQAEVDNEVANAMKIPEQTFWFTGGRFEVREKNNFTIGTKTHALYAVRNTYASFALDNFFHDHPSPNIEIYISQMVTSPRNASTAEVTSLKLNGNPVPYEFNWTNHEFSAEAEQWRADNAYVYPLGFLNSNAVFTVELSVRGEPGSYILYAILNWAPDTLHRYVYVIDDIVETPFGKCIPLGKGLPHAYNNIPFEIWGVSLSVYHTETSKFYEVYDLSGYIANKIHIIQASAWATKVPDNVVVGQIRVYYMDGTFSSLDLICGVNTAEWAYDRPENQLYLQHTKIPPAFSYWTNTDSAYFYWGHNFYVVIDTDEGKQLSYLELILDPRSYTSPADWYGISINAITLEVPLEIRSTIDIEPKTLNLRSSGKWITAYIELLEGYDVADINVSTIMLNGTVPAELSPTAIGDYDNDTVPDLMVKFDRAKTIEYILANVNTRGRFMTITLTITGKLNDGTPFQGSDTIKIIYINRNYEMLLAHILRYETYMQRFFN